MPLTFDLSVFSQLEAPMIQHAIDGANKAATYYPETWQFIAQGNLMRANRSETPFMNSPIASMIFKEMEQDRHSGASASYTLQVLTKLAREKLNLPLE
jgi:hypothetical protein